jgi:hypothetical protein
MLRRKLRHLASTVAVSAIAVAGLTLIGTRRVLAEFEIQEAGIEKGEVELEYRGAYHWGLPTVQAEEGEEEPEIPLRQSHDFEMQMGITNWWMLSATLGTVVPEGEDWQTESVEVENEVQFIKRHGDGIAFSCDVEYAAATQRDEPNEIQFGPIFEFSLGNFLLTTNTFFGRQLGEFADQEGLGLEYGWRAEYDFGKSKKWGVGVEMFGEIEDLANAGSFNDQNHSIGPTLFFKPGEAEDDDDEAGDVGEDDEAKGAPQPPKAEFSMNVGYQFGLTDVTSDGALKFQGSLAF